MYNTSSGNSWCCPSPQPKTTGCLIVLPGTCVTYTGLSIAGTTVHTGDNYNKTVNDLVTYINSHAGSGFISSLTTNGTSGAATVISGVLNIPQYSGATYSANEGLILATTVFKLGQTINQAGAPAKLLSNREVPLNGFNLSFPGVGLFLVGQSATSTLEKLQVFGTQRVQYTNPVDQTPQLLFANNAGTTLGAIRFDYLNVGSVYIGSNTGPNATGDNNIGIGQGTLASNTTGRRNIAIGASAMSTNTTASFNIAIGGDALDTGVGTLGNTNIAIGWDSFDNGFAVGTTNIVLGSFFNNSSGGIVGNNNIIISNGGSITGTSNTTIIGNTINTNVSNVVMLGKTTQNIILGGADNIADTTDRLQVYGSIFMNVLPTSLNSLLPLSWDTVTKRIVQGAGGGLTNPMTTVGDIIRGGASGAPQRLAAGTETFVLTITGGVPTWAAPSGGGGVGLANDGLTLISTTFKLGQNVGAGGNPAILLENREIPTGGFFIALSGTGNLILGGVTDQGSALQLPAGTATRAPLYIASGTLFTTLTSGQNGLFGEYDGVNFYAVPNGAVRQSVLLQNTILSAATTLTLNRTARTYSFTGGTATAWTLPAIAGNVNKEYLIKNRGTAIITLSAAGSDNFFSVGVVSAITINPGEAYIVTNDGSFWIVM